MREALQQDSGADSKIAHDQTASAPALLCRKRLATERIAPPDTFPLDRSRRSDCFEGSPPGRLPDRREGSRFWLAPVHTSLAEASLGATSRGQGVCIPKLPSRKTAPLGSACTGPKRTSPACWAIVAPRSSIVSRSRYTNTATAARNPATPHPSWSTTTQRRRRCLPPRRCSAWLAIQGPGGRRGPADLRARP